MRLARLRLPPPTGRLTAGWPLTGLRCATAAPLRWFASSARLKASRTKSPPQPAKPQQPGPKSKPPHTAGGGEDPNRSSSSAGGGTSGDADGRGFRAQTAAVMPGTRRLWPWILGMIGASGIWGWWELSRRRQALLADAIEQFPELANLPWFGSSPGQKDGDSWANACTSTVRGLRNAACVAELIYIYLSRLRGIDELLEPERYAAALREAHYAGGRRLAQLFEANGGLYIKFGQMIAVLEALVPPEYAEMMAQMFDRAPVDSFEQVCEMFQSQFGKHPDEVFEMFSREPIASASLAQVHTAFWNGQKVAVKVLHHGLREHAAADIWMTELCVRIVRSLFPSVDYGWLVDQVKESLPAELDFLNEVRNSERSQAFFAGDRELQGRVAFPKIHHQYSSHAVLTMDFMEGCRLSDLEAVDAAGLDREEIAHTISEIFIKQIFFHGFVHADPHPGNLIARRNRSTGRVEIVVLDHGLYRDIDEDFRIDYCKLWQALVRGDVDQIRESCLKMNAGDYWKLLACMVTGRSWKHITDPSIGAMAPTGDPIERERLRSFAKQHVLEIGDVLGMVPQKLLLLFKTNDTLNNIYARLGVHDAEQYLLISEGTQRALNQWTLTRQPGGPSWSQRLVCWWRLVLVRMGIAVFRLQQWLNKHLVGEQRVREAARARARELLSDAATIFDPDLGDMGAASQV